jgi:hypothetical protein
MQVLQHEQIERNIIEIRGHKVILDSDVAKLYGVETKRINEAVSRNSDKFPDGYLITLTETEWGLVKSQIATSPLGGGKVKRPVAFTEKGLYMLATILKSQTATQTTLLIIDTFAKVREIGNTVNKLTTLPEDSPQQKALINRTGELLSELIQASGLDNAETEASIELNLALVKFKYTVKKAKA